MIVLKGIKKEYRNGSLVTEILKGIDLTIDAGEFVAIRGSSGSGKSTLLHILGLLDKPTSGTYAFDGQEVGAIEEDARAAIRNRKIGFVFQAFYLLPRTTVLENVLLPTVYGGALSEKAAEERARELLASVNLSHRVNNHPNQISGGEMQRTAIARALMNNPEVIFADEPTGNLDVQNSAQVMEIFHRLHEAGKTIIMVTHEDEIARQTERIIHIRDGKILGTEIAPGNPHKNRVKA